MHRTKRASYSRKVPILSDSRNRELLVEQAQLTNDITGVRNAKFGSRYYVLLVNHYSSDKGSYALLVDRYREYPHNTFGAPTVAESQKNLIG